MQKILSLTNNVDEKLLLNYEKNKIIFINDTLSLKKKIKKNYFYIYNSSPSKKKITNVYRYCEKKYNNIFKDLVIQLNKVHNLTFSNRFWEIIIGRWLIDFIYICHKNYFNCKNILKNYKFLNYIALEKNKYNICTSNTIEAANATNDPDWNFALNSKIMSFLKVNINPIYIKVKTSNYKLKTNNIKIKNNFKFLLKKIFFKILSFFQSSKKQDIFVYNTSLPLVYEKILELSLDQIPKYFEAKKEYYCSFSEFLRKKMLLETKCRDKFEIFLRKIIPEAIPIFAMEAFKKNLNLSKKINFPKNPKFIFTCYAYQSDELFKIYLAEQCEKNTKYFCGQHGNNYFTAHQSSLSIELKTCDKFLSWGYKNKKKILPFFNFSLISKIKKKRLFNKSGNLLIICSKVGLNRSPIERINVDKNSIENILEVAEKLSGFINKNLTFRLSKTHLNEYSGFYYKKYFLNTNFKIDFGDTKLEEMQRNSRLNLFNYYSTGLLENLLLNIPSVCYLQKDFEYQNHLFQKKIKYLINANIVFYDKEKLVKHIKKIWNNIDNWWLSDKTKKLVKNFNKDFNQNIQDIKKLKKFFENEKNKN